MVPRRRPPESHRCSGPPAKRGGRWSLLHDAYGATAESVCQKKRATERQKIRRNEAKRRLHISLALLFTTYHEGESVPAAEHRVLRISKSSRHSIDVACDAGSARERRDGAARDIYAADHIVCPRVGLCNSRVENYSALPSPPPHPTNTPAHPPQGRTRRMHQLPLQTCSRTAPLCRHRWLHPRHQAGQQS